MAYAMKDVKTLRTQTGSPLKDCVQAIEESNGDLDAAREFLRKKGLTAANKRAGRDANQGFIGLKQSANLITMVELNCETDFVAKTDAFIGGLEHILDTLHLEQSELTFSGKETPEEVEQKIREI